MWANREVVARDRRSGLHMDYTAVGQTTHLAGRTEQFDEPGTILLAPATLALCQDFVQAKIDERAGANPFRSYFQAHVPRLDQIRRARERAGATWPGT